MMESDPNGLDPNQPGAKLDANKPNLDLVLGDFSRALIEVGRIGTFGANKYSKSGWLKVDNAKERYQSAELRHYFKEKIEGEFDLDSGLLHSAHRAWNALAYLELLLREVETSEFTSLTIQQKEEWKRGYI